MPLLPSCKEPEAFPNIFDSVTAGNKKYFKRNFLFTEQTESKAGTEAQLCPWIFLGVIFTPWPIQKWQSSADVRSELCLVHLAHVSRDNKTHLRALVLSKCIPGLAAPGTALLGGTASLLTFSPALEFL